MIGYKLKDECFTYINKATGDKWNIQHEEYEVLDTKTLQYKVYYTASFHLPPELTSIKIIRPFLSIIPDVLVGLLDEAEENKAEELTVTEKVEIPKRYRPTTLTFKGSGVADSKEELRKQRVILYKDIMDNIHKYNVMGILPAEIREKIEEGVIPY
jgi:hypothetical protein